jgi:hypothetical protein
MSDKTAPEFFTEGFTVTDRPDYHASHRPVTVWIPIEYKAEYDNLQKRSARQFSEWMRKIFMMEIDKAKANLKAG